MTDFATLVMTADATGLAKGEAALASLAAKGTAAEAQVARATKGISKGFAETGAAASASGQGVRMAMMQLGQVTQQAAMTGNYVQALGMQMGDLLPMLGVTGLAGMALSAAAVMAPLAGNLMQVSDKAKALDDSLEGLTDSIGAYRDAVSGGSLDKLSDIFGAVTPEIVDLQERIQALRLREVMLDAADAAKTLSTSMDQIMGDNAFYGVTELFGGTEAQISAMAGAFERLQQATTLDAQVAAIDEMQSSILAATGGVDNMTAAQAEFYGKTLEAESALRQAEAAASGVAGAVSGAADEAGRLALNAASAVDAFNAASRARAVGVGGGRGNGMAEWRQRQADQQGSGQEFLATSGTAMADQIRKALSTHGGGGKRGGGGGISDEMRDAQKWFDRTRTAAEQYAATQAELNGLLSSGRISQDTYNRAMEQAKDKLESMDGAARKGRNALEDMFGSILDGSMSAKDAVLQLIAQIAKVQMMKAIMGIPGVGGVASFLGGLLSYDGGGYTGSAQRSGGIDGKGGFLAVMHPRETVLDHTKGQSAAQSVQVNVTHSPYFDVRVAEVSSVGDMRTAYAQSRAMPSAIREMQARRTR